MSIVDKYNAKKANELNDRQKSLDNVFAPGNPFFSVSGTKNEQEGKLEGLQRAKTLTGQNPYEIGANFQEAFSNLKKRTQMDDTGSELLRASKAGAVADAKNNLRQQGIKGGAAVGAASSVERAKGYDVNNQLMQNQRQAENDYMNATKAIANFTQQSEMGYGAMAADKDYKGPANFSNGFGTVICTELFLQDYYDLETYIADQEYGLMMIQNHPEIYIGYRFLADPVVKLMRNSKIFTSFVAIFACPWAENMAGKKNLLGKLISVVGEPICGLIGKLILRRIKYVRN
jgi:hypothetical protein